MAKCPNCGAPMQGNVCSYCHYESSSQNDNKKASSSDVVYNNYNSPPKKNIVVYEDVVSSHSKTTALILCIFLGFYGAHNFYVGKIGKGVLYLFTGGLFLVGWIIDIILILTNNFKDANGLPVKY